MLKREEVIQELWKRIAGTSGVVYSTRNSETPPAVSNLPAVQFFELEDIVIKSSMRGGFPTFQRDLTVVVEVFIKGSTPSATSQELMAQLSLLKKAIYAGGPSLGGLCSITEKEASRVMRPEVGENVAGIGIVFILTYTEDAANS